MVSPVSSTEDDPQARRKAVILQELSRISKQHKITLDEDVISLQNLVEVTVGEAQRLSKGLDKRRATRTVFGKSGNALQKFTSTFSQFLKAYPGISDLSKGANAHYGGMVVGTLSLLFQVRASHILLWKGRATESPKRSARTRKVVRLLSILL